MSAVIVTSVAVTAFGALLALAGVVTSVWMSAQRRHRAEHNITITIRTEEGHETTADISTRLAENEIVRTLRGALKQAERRVSE